MQNLSPQDIESWFRTASPEQGVQVGQTALKTIAGYPQEHRDRFANNLSSDVKSRLFERETT